MLAPTRYPSREPRTPALVILVCVSLFGCGGARARPEPEVFAARATLADVAWLVGVFHTDGGSPSYESWHDEGSADGRQTLGGEGWVQDAAGARTVTERLEIIPRDDGLVYVATPVDQLRTEFIVTEIDEAHFLAENPTHDFPTRIEYQRTETGMHVIVSSAERRFELDFLRE